MMQHNNNEKINEIHHFWFGDDSDTVAGAMVRRERWFMVSGDFDNELRRLFGDEPQRAADGVYASWEETALGTLSLILVMDQFPRNIFRGSPQAFAYDERALALCLGMIDSGRERELSFIERMFMGMPFQHSEDIAVQRRSGEWFAQWAGDAPDGFEEFAAGTLQYAKLHIEIVERFGRFPHRNAILGRDSTAEESAYLESSGMDFGQSAG